MKSEDIIILGGLALGGVYLYGKLKTAATPPSIPETFPQDPGQLVSLITPGGQANAFLSWLSSLGGASDLLKVNSFNQVQLPQDVIDQYAANAYQQNALLQQYAKMLGNVKGDILPKSTASPAETAAAQPGFVVLNGDVQTFSSGDTANTYALATGGALFQTLESANAYAANHPTASSTNGGTSLVASGKIQPVSTAPVTTHYNAALNVTVDNLTGKIVRKGI